MKYLITLVLLTAACGQKLKPISHEELNSAASQGFSIERAKSSPSQSLSLKSGNNQIFQIYHFNDYPQVVSKIIYDSDLVQGQAVPEEHCLKTIENHKEGFAVDGSLDLTFVKRVQISSHITQVSFKRSIDGTQVRGAFIDCLYSKFGDGQYKLTELVNNAYFHLPVLEHRPLSLDDLKKVFPLGEVSGELNELYVIANGSLYAATEFEYLDEEEKVFRLILDSYSGEIIQGAPQDLHLKSSLLAHVYDRTYMDGELKQEALPLTEVSANGRVHTTSKDGSFDFEGNISEVFLDSDRVQVRDRNNVIISLKNVNHGGAAARIQAEGEDLAALNSYAAIHRVNKFARQFLSPTNVPFLDEKVLVKVNQTGRECNAYYSTGISRITLFKEGGGCANLGTVNDVIFHEWGHGLDDHTGREGGVLDGAFSEGIGDIVSAYFNQDPQIGIGFVENAQYGIRDISRLKTFPEDAGEVHAEGGIISGAFWALNVALKERYGSDKGKRLAAQLFFKHLMMADTYLESYDAVLRLDDNDGNPATRSPNFCLINKVFSDRGLARPDSCEDGKVEIYKSDKDLNAALYDIAGGNVGLVASGLGAKQIFICFGTQGSCLADKRVHFQLSSVNNNESRGFFSYEGALDLNGVDTFTLISKDANGKVLGSRELGIFSK